MRSNVKDYDFYKQSYVEELIRQLMPDVKINNIVPWQVTTDTSLGTNEFAVIDTILYFGFFQGGHSTQSIISYDAANVLVGVGAMPYPLLFKGMPSGATNYNNIRFVGWKITIENKGFQLNPPKPPKTPPVIEGFDLFLFELNEQNPLDKYNAIFTFGKINMPVMLKFISIKDGGEFDLAYSASVANYLQLELPIDITEGVRVVAKTVSSGVVVMDETFDYLSFPLDFVATKPADDLILTFSGNSTKGVYQFHSDFPQVAAYNQADMEPIDPGSSTGSEFVKTFANVDYMGATELVFEYQVEFVYVIQGGFSPVVEVGHPFFVYNNPVI